MVVGTRFPVQLKSNLSTLVEPIGAPRKRRGQATWRQNEVKWLLGRPPFPTDITPLFLGHVDLPTSTLLRREVLQSRSPAALMVSMGWPPDSADQVS